MVWQFWGRAALPETPGAETLGAFFIAVIAAASGNNQSSHRL